MPSLAAQRFDSNLEDVADLLAIHLAATGRGKGKRTKQLAVLHKAGIVLLTAAWESYVESVVTECADFLATQVLSGPPPVKFAALQDLLKQNVSHAIGRFHTPNWVNVRDLFRQVLGMPDVTIAWNRRNMNYMRARATLNEWLDDRHGIAHGGIVKSFLKLDVESYRQFLQITVLKTDEATRSHSTSDCALPLVINDSRDWPKVRLIVADK